MDEEDEGLDNEAFFQSVKDKLLNPEILEKIYHAKFDIEKALDCQVIISVPNIEKKYAEEIFNLMNNIGIDKKSGAMKLGYLVDILAREPRDLNVCMDTLHFEKGVNQLKDIIIIPMEGYIVLIPKSKI